MKTYHIFLLVLTCLSNSLIAGPLQIRLAVKLEGVDNKWFSDVKSLDQGKVIKIPEVLARPSEEVIVKVVKSYSAKPSAGRFVETPCGFTMKLTPKFDTEGIALRGSMTFKRSLDAYAGNIANQFETSEIPIGCVLKNNTEKKIKLATGGHVLITAILLDAAGEPVKLNIE